MKSASPSNLDTAPAAGAVAAHFSGRVELHRLFFVERNMRVGLASLAVLSVSGGSAWATAFRSCRTACLDSGGGLAKVRATATAKGWGKLWDADREILAPGNERAVEGWAISEAGGR